MTEQEFLDRQFLQLRRSLLAASCGQRGRLQEKFLFIFSLVKKLQQREDRAGSNAIGGNPSSTERWNDVPRGTMDEVSSLVCLDLLSVRREGRR
jgi:hypothetical protein